MYNTRESSGHRRTQGVAVALAACLLFSGCGSDDDGDDSADTTATTATTAATTAAPADTDTSAASAEGTDPDGGDAGDSGATGELDVCGLLEGVDIEAVLGEPVGDPEASGTKCSFDAIAADSTGAINVMVDPAGGTEAFERQRDLLGGDDISGLGDQAFSSGTWVHVVSGDTYLYVQAVPNPLGTVRVDIADLEGVAADVLTALG